MDKKLVKSRPIPKPTISNNFVADCRIGRAIRPTPTPRIHNILLDKPIPLIDVPILKPIPYTKPKNRISLLKTLAKSATQSVNQKLMN